jgi:hypothetical protein
MGELARRGFGKAVMTMTAVRPEIADEIEAAEEVRKDAEAAYFSILAGLVNMSTLTGGRHGYDFQVEAPAADLHVLSQRIVDLEYDVRDRFNVHFRTYIVPV